MRATSWTGSENARRQEPTERKPSPYAEDLRLLMQAPTPRDRTNPRDNRLLIPLGSSVEIRRISPDGPWEKHKTRKSLGFPRADSLDGKHAYFHYQGYRIRIEKKLVSGLTRRA